MPSADKVRSNDPRLRDRYNQRVLKAFEDEDWNRYIRLQLGVLTSREAIKRLAKTIANIQGSILPFPFVSVGSSQLTRSTRKRRMTLFKWRTDFQETFVTAKAKERGLSEKVVIKQMKREK